MKRILSVLLLLILVFTAFAKTAIIKEVKGKVKIKLPGKSWELAEANTEITKGTVISTGFKSQAILDLGDSFITVKALTRMKLEELLEREDTVQTDIYLNFGKVSAEVKSSDEKEHDFKLKSPVSTAAVRGTRLEYNMFSVFVVNGLVEFINELNQKRFISQGGGTFTVGFNWPANMEETQKGDFWVSASTGDELFPVNTGPDSTGTIEITW